MSQKQPMETGKFRSILIFIIGLTITFGIWWGVNNYSLRTAKQEAFPFMPEKTVDLDMPPVRGEILPLGISGTLDSRFNQYSQLSDITDKINFLAQLEDRELSDADWEFLLHVGFEEQSAEVIEALLITADMSENNDKARSFFTKFSQEHRMPSVRELADDLLSER